MAVAPERGSATVLTVGASGTVVVVVAAVLVLLAAVRDVHRARGAADLAALAAAVPLAGGGAPDCSAAAWTARANGAAMTGCAATDDGSVVVSVTVRLAGASTAWYLPPSVTARARAGLADEEPP